MKKRQVSNKVNDNSFAGKIEELCGKTLTILRTKKNYEVIVVPILHYTTENWKMNRSDKRKEFVVWMKILRLMAGFILLSVEKYINTE